MSDETRAIKAGDAVLVRATVHSVDPLYVRFSTFTPFNPLDRTISLGMFQGDVLLASLVADARREALEEAAQHTPTIKTDPTEAWVACSCGMQSFGTGRTWADWWGDHIRSLAAPAQPESQSNLEEK